MRKRTDTMVSVALVAEGQSGSSLRVKPTLPIGAGAGACPQTMAERAGGEREERAQRATRSAGR